MPHAILYHGFGIRGYRHLKTQFKEGCIYFYLVRKKSVVPSAILSKLPRRDLRREHFAPFPSEARKCLLL